MKEKKLFLDQMHKPLLYFFTAQTLVVLLFLGIFGSNWSPSLASGTSPILIVVNDSAPNPFGRYLAEIMRAEGLNTYNLIDISAMTPAVLTGYEVVILAETPLNSTQATDLTDYVNTGGRLLAMRPDILIAPLFGINTISGPLTDGYLKISNTMTLTAGSIPPGTGLVTQTLQIHGNADQYTLNGGALTLAQLYSNINTPTSYPAVVAGSGGKAVAFAYDLPRNIVFTRQGNPANANLDTDNDGVTRTIDLFQTTGGGNPWVDRDRIPVPQADEQQRFFARLVKHLVGFHMPLPQLWYFPESAKTMLILTSDGHSNPSEWYTSLITAVETYSGDISIYLSISTPPQSPNEEAYLSLIRSMGNEFGIHPPALRDDPGYPPFDIDNLAEGYQVLQNWWNIVYTDGDGNPLPMARTTRNHQVAWTGWADIAETARTSYGIHMDTSYYHYGNWIKKPDNSWPMGYITGSGQPMKFVKENGTILDIYQMNTQLVDEHIVGGAGLGWMGLTYTQAITVSQALIDSSLTRDYAALMTQFHVDYSSHGDALEWASGVMAYANTNDVPLWSADNWLTFTETRYGTNFTNMTWNGVTGVLNFDLEVEASPGMTLTLMVPAIFKTRTLQSVTIDGGAAPISLTTIKGVTTAFVEIPDGSPLVAYDIIANYSSPTAITLQSLVSQVRTGVQTDAAATLLVLLGSATLVFLLERRRRATA